MKTQHQIASVLFLIAAIMYGASADASCSSSPVLLEDFACYKGIDVGSLYDQPLTGEPNEYYDALDHFNAITMNGFNWQSIAPNYCIDQSSCNSDVSPAPTIGGTVVTTGTVSDVYPYLSHTYLDSLKAKMQDVHSDGKKVHASHLTWGAKNSKATWLWENLNASGVSQDYRLLTKTQYENVLENYVTELVSYYAKSNSTINSSGAYVDIWSVANEYFSEETIYPYGGGNFWLDKLDPMPNNLTQGGSGRLDIDHIENSYLAKVLTWARAADPCLDENSDPQPCSVLMLNDYDNESINLTGSKSDKIINHMYETVSALKRSEIPLDAIGMQMHLKADQYDFDNYGTAGKVSKNDVIYTIEKFGALGVSVYITEIDVQLSSDTGKTNDEKLEEQAQIYREMLEACLATSFCVSYTTWGIGDEQSYDPYGQLLLFNKKFVPKPAFTEIFKVLSNFDDDAYLDDIDTDDDGDGTADSSDKFPYNSSEYIDGDDDGIPYGDDMDDSDADERIDADGDGVSDQIDNCPTVSNSSQTNTDGGMQGDACDFDDDDDGLDDEVDLDTLDSQDTHPYVLKNITAASYNLLSFNDSDTDNAPDTDETMALTNTLNDKAKWKLIRRIDACGFTIFNVISNLQNSGTDADIGSYAYTGTGDKTIAMFLTSALDPTWPRAQWGFSSLGDTNSNGVGEYNIFSIYGDANSNTRYLSKKDSGASAVGTESNGGSCASGQYCSKWEFQITTGVSDNAVNLEYDNIYQLDNDSDGDGNDCDSDDDNDGVADSSDNCPLIANGVSEDNQLDTDSDGKGNACDDDDDADGIADAYDPNPLTADISSDFDSDSTSNDDDDFPFNASASLDTDADGKPDSCVSSCTGDLVEDTDDDNDGVLDTSDAYPLDPTQS